LRALFAIFIFSLFSDYYLAASTNKRTAAALRWLHAHTHTHAEQRCDARRTRRGWAPRAARLLRCLPARHPPAARLAGAFPR